MKRLADLAMAAAIILLVAFVACPTLDKRGWIPHRQVTRVFSPVEQPWTTGEYLDCEVDQGGNPTRKGYGYSGIVTLGCARDWESNKEHLQAQEIQVIFWGRIAIPYPDSAWLYWQSLKTPDSAHYNERPFRWRCRRNESSLTCWAVN